LVVYAARFDAGHHWRLLAEFPADRIGLLGYARRQTCGIRLAAIAHRLFPLRDLVRIRIGVDLRIARKNAGRCEC
jgi:hypothetical protein